MYRCNLCVQAPKKENNNTYLQKVGTGLFEGKEELHFVNILSCCRTVENVSGMTKSQACPHKPFAYVPCASHNENSALLGSIVCHSGEHREILADNQIQS